MRSQEIILMLDELLELDPGTLKGNELLKELHWDSLAIIGFIALADEKCSVSVSPKDIACATTINDLVALVENKLCVV